METEPYVRVEPIVFNLLLMYGIDASEAGSYFVEVANKLKTCPPNIRIKNNLPPKPIWVLRDFFPGTTYMFKMTMVYHSTKHQLDYHGDPSLKEEDFTPAIWINVKNIPCKAFGKIHVPYGAAQKYSMAKAANILLGDNLKPEPFMCGKWFNKPKRMFPKGYQVEDSVNKRPPHIHNKRSRRKKDVPRASAGEPGHTSDSR